MPDLLRSEFRGPRPVEAPAGFLEWAGYRLPHGRTFTWTDLVAVAAANGHDLSRDMLRKWRLWDFLPPPVPGGSTGHGPGKGETWSREAALCVAWTARWQTDALTYDLLRLALWPYRPAFPLGSIQAALVAFLKADRDYHGRVQDGNPAIFDAGLEAYLDVVEPFAGKPRGVGRLLVKAGIRRTDRRFAQKRALLGYLSHDWLLAWLHEVPSVELADFGRALHLQSRDRVVRLSFWHNPAGLARIVCRELLRNRLIRAGRIPTIDNSP